jgi:histidine decarboxylase
MVGAPLPCGVVIAKKSNVERIARRIEYIGTLDTTIAGSRNALTPLLLWYAFRTLGLDGLRERVQRCFEVADYAIDRLQELGFHAWRHRNSVIVVFERPSDEVVHRWQLAVHREVAHLIAMPHVTRDLIDRFIVDLGHEDAQLATESSPS